MEAQATAAYRSRDFTKAAGLFTRMADAAPQKPILRYNAARAWHKAGALAVAAQHYARFIQATSPQLEHHRRAVTHLAAIKAQQQQQHQQQQSAQTPPTASATPISATVQERAAPGGSHWRRPAMWITGALGVIGLGVGAAVYGRGALAARDLDRDLSEYDQNDRITGVTWNQAVQRRDAVERDYRAGGATLIAGGALVALGAYFWASSSERYTTASLSLRNGAAQWSLSVRF